MSEHTPTPWQYGGITKMGDTWWELSQRGFAGSVVIAWSPKNHDYGSQEHHQENMKFIVEAVNSHEALLEVKRCAEELSKASKEVEGDLTNTPYEWKKLRAALKAAGGIQ